MFSGEGKTKTCFFVVVLILILVLTVACGGKQDDKEAISYDIQLYFANSEYVESGDEGLGVYIVDARTIEPDENENPWLLVVEELKNPGSDQLWTAVDKDVEIKEIYVDKENPQTLIVDLVQVGSGGSLKEGIFIGQIVKTCIENSETIEEDASIDKVQFVLKGEIVESLMGHYDSSGPFKMEDI